MWYWNARGNACAFRWLSTQRTGAVQEAFWRALADKGKVYRHSE